MRHRGTFLRIKEDSPFSERWIRKLSYRMDTESCAGFLWAGVELNVLMGLFFLLGHLRIFGCLELNLGWLRLLRL